MSVHEEKCQVNVGLWGHLKLLAHRAFSRQADSDLQPIFQFIDKWKPSSVLFDHVKWLTVGNELAKNSDHEVDTLGLLASWENLCLTSQARLTTCDTEILTLAHNVLHGKWLIFVDSDNVDEEWAKVVDYFTNQTCALFEEYIREIVLDWKQQNFVLDTWVNKLFFVL